MTIDNQEAKHGGRSLIDGQTQRSNCGVGFVARLDGVPLHEVVEHGRARAREPGAPRRGRRRQDHRRRRRPAAAGARPLPARRSRQARDRAPRRRRRTASAWSSCPRAPTAAARCVRADRAPRASRGPRAPRLARRAGLGRPPRRLLARDAAGDPPGLPRPRRRRPPTPSSASSTSCAASPRRRPPAGARRSRATSTSPSLSARTILYKGMLTGTQLLAVLPGPRATRRSRARSPSCTSATRRTRSPPGRSRSPSACSRTTARSTRCAATSTGCAPARRSSPPRSSATTCEKL